MKLSEKLAEMKQREGELMRLYTVRDSVTKRTFSDTLLKTEDVSLEVLEGKQKDFFAKKKEKLLGINESIDKLRQNIVDGRNVINKKNIEVGLDRKLAEMKFLRLELSKLMNTVKTGGRFSYLEGEGIDIDIYEELGISQRIKDLESKKSKLDSEIQSVNWNTEIDTPSGE